ncbi:hypothetical protein [Acinetobacter baumannii]|uniref:hypothetical protein n=1 Tax=Acinetobacter baumannii TaxID=470 RepID=UPI00210075DB
MNNFLNNKKILIVGAGGLLGIHLVDSMLKQGAKVIADDLCVDLMREGLNTLGVDLNNENLSII